MFGQRKLKLKHIKPPSPSQPHIQGLVDKHDWTVCNKNYIPPTPNTGMKSIAGYKWTVRKKNYRLPPPPVLVWKVSWYMSGQFVENFIMPGTSMKSLNVSGRIAENLKVQSKMSGQFAENVIALSTGMKSSVAREWTVQRKFYYTSQY